MPIQNGVMMQFVHWYGPGDGTLWSDAAGRAHELVAAGFLTNDAGWGEFRCNGGSVSVWAQD